MTDSQLYLQSVHLEAPERRSDFRAARERLIHDCGNNTLQGRLADLAPDAPTQDGPLHGVNSYALAIGGHEFPLAPGINTVGRMAGNAVTIADQHISRRHCAVVVHLDGRVMVHDVASKNGTVVNGLRIPGPTQIHPGDVISLCGRRAVLVTRVPPDDPLDGLFQTDFGPPRPE